MNLVEPFDVFCSDQCLITYIKKAAVGKTLIAKNKPVVGYDFQNYDFVTKKLYRSLYEVWLARCLYKNNIVFEYEPHSFFVDGRYYTPDFYVPEKEIYIECKGMWMRKAKHKVKALREKAHLILLPSYFQNRLKKYKKKDDLVK